MRHCWNTLRSKDMQNSPDIVRIRKAGPAHQVVTLVYTPAQLKSRSSTLYPIKPCPKCPWRPENVGLFPAEAFRHSAHTAYDQAKHIFACHSSKLENSKICTGFLLKGAEHNLSVRLLYIQGKIRPPLEPGCELFGSYRAMAEGNGVPRDDPAHEYTR